MNPQALRARSSALLVLLVAFAAACGPNARQAQLRATMTGLVVASDGLVAYSAARQAEIVSTATSEVDGAAKLAAFRTERAKVLAALATGFHALAAAAILDNDHASLASAIASALEVSKALAALKELR